MEGVWKGYLFFQKLYIKGKVVGPHGRPTPYKTLLSAPLPPHPRPSILDRNPKSRMKAHEGPIHAIFPSLIWGEGSLGFPFIFSGIDLEQIKMEKQTRSPPNQRRSHAKGKTHHFPIFDLREGGLGFPFILSKTVDTTNILIMNNDQILNGLMTYASDGFHSQFRHINNGWLLKRYMHSCKLSYLVWCKVTTL